MHTLTYIKSYTTAEDGGDSAAMDRVLPDKRQRKKKKKGRKRRKRRERDDIVKTTRMFPGMLLQLDK